MMGSAEDIGSEIRKQKEELDSTNKQLGELEKGIPIIHYFTDNFIKAKVKTLRFRKNFETQLNDTPIAWDVSEHGTTDAEYDHCLTRDLSYAFELDVTEDHSNWSSEGISVTLSTDTDSGTEYEDPQHFWGNAGTKIFWTGSSGEVIIKNESNYDLSDALNATSGDPSQGTSGLWFYIPTGVTISDIYLDEGSDSSNYYSFSGSIAPGQNDEFLPNTLSGARQLILFDMDNASSKTGTPDWENCDYRRIRFTVTGAGYVTISYLSVSDSNVVTMCSAGERKGEYYILQETNYQQVF